MAKCSSCNFAVLVDFGYSNLTVQGTTVHCSKLLHPAGEYDLWYGEDARDLHARECPEFSDSDGPAVIDCDRDEIPRNAAISDVESWAAYATNHVPAKTLRDIVT